MKVRILNVVLVLAIATLTLLPELIPEERQTYLCETPYWSARFPEQYGQPNVHDHAGGKLTIVAAQYWERRFAVAVQDYDSKYVLEYAKLEWLRDGFLQDITTNLGGTLLRTTRRQLNATTPFGYELVYHKSGELRSVWITIHEGKMFMVTASTEGHRTLHSEMVCRFYESVRLRTNGQDVTHYASAQ